MYDGYCESRAFCLDRDAYRTSGRRSADGILKHQCQCLLETPAVPGDRRERRCHVDLDGDTDTCTLAVDRRT